MPAKDSYHDYLIESLKDAHHAAAYLEACLEESDPEPELLRQVLLNIAEALGTTAPHSPTTKVDINQLDEVLSAQGSTAIYGLVNWLNQLGLKLTIAVQEPVVDDLAMETPDSQLVA